MLATTVTSNATNPKPSALMTESLTASSGLNASNVAILRLGLGSGIEQHLAVGSIIFQRATHGFDDRARRDRRTGELIEVAAVFANRPTLRLWIMQRLLLKAL